MSKKVKDNSKWIVIVIVIIASYFVFQMTGNLVSELPEEIIEFRFYELGENCSLIGRIFVDGEHIGDTSGDRFLLNESVYFDKFSKEVKVSIIGRTGPCFKKNLGLPFKGVWTVGNLDYYFLKKEPVVFEMSFNPRRPYYLEEKQGFVRPDRVGNYLEGIEKYFREGDLMWNFDRIAEYPIKYRSDFLLFDEEEYWQTPEEVLKSGHGDCEDWAVTTLSLMRAYNSSVECYNSLWSIHLSIICFLDDSMIIYDQGDTRFITSLDFYGLSEQEKKERVRKVRDNYFDEFGLEPEDRMLSALFNEKDLITFETEEDFIDWVVSRE